LAEKAAIVAAEEAAAVADLAEKAKAVAEKNGYDWTKFCVIDNSCPAQAEEDYSKAVNLGWDDIPDLIEWFAPGTTRGGTKKEANFMGDY